jgi:hypothetical protein
VPVFSTNANSRNSVGPAMNTARARAIAATMLTCDSRLMPRSSPRTTEMVASAVIPAIRATRPRSLPAVPPEDPVEAGRDLHGAEPQGRRDPEQRGDDGEDVDGVADGTVDAVTEQRVEQRPDRHRELEPEPDVGEPEPDDGVDGPRAEAPVVEDEVHRLLVAGLGERLGDGGAPAM